MADVLQAIKQRIAKTDGLFLNDIVMLKENILISKIVTSIFIFIIIMGIRRFIIKKLARTNDLPPTERRQYVVIIKNTAMMIFLVFLTIIWFEQIRTVAASLIVIAAAIVVATKEFLLNVLGYLYRSSAKFVQVGDRIQIGDLRGDVIDQNITGVTLMEIGPGTKTHQYTGLTVFIPNVSFLSQPVKNETHMWEEDFVFHIINVPVKVDSTWQEHEASLLRAANEICGPYIEKARKNMKNLAQKYSLEQPTVDPRIHIQISDTDKAALVLRVPVPSRQRGRIEQEISRKYLAYVSKSPEEKKETTSEPT